MSHFPLIYTQYNNIQDLERERSFWIEWLKEFFDNLLIKNSKQKTLDSISESACILSEEKQYSAIIISTLTGRTTNMISRFHPKVKIIPVVHHEISLRKMLLGYGCFPVNIGTSFDDLTELVDETIKVAKDAEHIKVGQEIVYIAGSPLWTVGEANLIQIRKID